MVTDLFTGINQEVLLSVFESWVNGLKWAVKQEGKYYTQGRKQETFSQE
jgi:hypothetical protein